MTEFWFVVSHSGAFVLGVIVGMWALQWACKKRRRHETETETLTLPPMMMTTEDK